ncbi:MAG: hypothetical protein WBP41_08250 [Saprospiraceae bacterium]
MKQVYEVRIVKAFFLSLGLIHKRTESSHFQYDFPDDHPGGCLNRPLILREHLKDVPLHHIHTSLKTLGLPKSTFEKWLNDQHKGKNKKSNI